MVKAGDDVVKVKVLEVDLPRKRIALTMRMSDEPPAPARASHRRRFPRSAALCTPPESRPARRNSMADARPAR